MNALTRNSASTSPTGIRFRANGFTIVELLVTISIITVLAVLSVMGVGRLKLAAAKSTSASQMRQMSVAIHLWMGDKSLNEPMYFGNGTGDYGHESAPGANSALAPGNPARVLFDRTDPNNSYLTDHALFFTPLSKARPPERHNYAPDQAISTKLWGTYAYYYPLATSGEMTTRQRDSIGAVATRKTGVYARGKLLLATDYENSVPIWEPYYMALMIDGSVKEVAKTRAAWRKWAFDE
ncbi:MAG: prepilin-type N-terminal cleavage/methylation domain-containing protein [Akkermansiaceae bacterium]